MRLSLNRNWVDTDGMLSITFSIERGDGYAMSQEVFVYPGTLQEFGYQLQKFPSSSSDEAVLEMGSQDEDAYSWVRLRAYVYDGSGHTALHVAANHNPSKHLQAGCQFSMPVEAASLNLLGAKIEAWSATPEIPFEFAYRASHG